MRASELLIHSFYPTFCCFQGLTRYIRNYVKYSFTDHRNSIITFRIKLLRFNNGSLI